MIIITGILLPKTKLTMRYNNPDEQNVEAHNMLSSVSLIIACKYSQTKDYSDTRYHFWYFSTANYILVSKIK